MKKILTLVLMVAMLSVSAFATTTTLSPDSINMDYTDVKVVTFCINSSKTHLPMDVAVDVSPQCKDVNGLEGCQGADTANPPGFSVVPNDANTGADGCVDLTITTSLSPGQEGLFYYTVNGKVGDAVVGSETGLVFVPEFGVVAAGLALAGAGVYIARKRKQ